MKKALLRLEDFCPGGFYNSSENLQKMKIIADFLCSENVCFNISLTPRYVDPAANYDKSIDDVNDPYIAEFKEMLQYLLDHGGVMGMHGYTHQYGLSRTGDGFEFYYEGCESDCPPDDSPDSAEDLAVFANSYASARMRDGYNAIRSAGLRMTVDFGYSTPHYTASKNQRCILESWAGIFFENEPESPYQKQVTVNDVDHEFYRGAVYVPTPLYYVRGQEDVERICTEIHDYTEKDTAAFFYHPYLEFPFIRFTSEGEVFYDDNSYLKQIIRCFIEQGFYFPPLDQIVHFAPSTRQTGVFPGKDRFFFPADVNADNRTDFIVWHPETGTWNFLLSNLSNYPQRQIGGFSVTTALTSWGRGENWQPLTGDFNGDKQADVVIYNSAEGSCYIALSNGTQLKPESRAWLNSWGAGEGYVPFAGDFNGDGKDDILFWHPESGEWRVALSTGSNFTPSGTWLSFWAAGSYWVPKIGDFNGDGKADILVWDPNTGDWQAALSTGSSFIPAPGPGDYLWLRDWAVGTEWLPLIGDFNGDGKDDILAAAPSRGDWQIAINNGNSFEPTHCAFAPWAAESDMQPFAGNFINDPRTAICARHPLIRNGTIDIALSILC